MRFFLAVATGGGLSAAARALGVSQVTVWRHIAALEKSLGARLFEHHSSGYSLSSAGEKLLGAAQQIDETLQGARRSIAGIGDEIDGEVRVTAPEAIGVGLLAKHAHVLAAEHPRLRLEIVSGTPASMLGRRETDIALRYDEGGHRDFVLEAKFRIAFAIYASERYLAARGRPRGIDQFENHALVAFDDSFGHVAPARWSRKGGRGAHIVFRSNSLFARVTAAQMGQGCVLLPRIIGDTTDDLVPVFSEADVGDISLSVLVNGRIRQSPRVAAVVRFVTGLLGRTMAAS